MKLHLSVLSLVVQQLFGVEQLLIIACSSDGITLRHSRFNQFGYSLNETCEDSGPIIGRAISVVNDSYTSQLIVNVSQSLIGANIECSNYSGSIVGTEQILLTTGTFQSMQ